MTEETEWEARERCSEKPFDKIEEIIKSFEDLNCPECNGRIEYFTELTDFLRQSLHQYRKSIEEEIGAKIIQVLCVGDTCKLCRQSILDEVMEKVKEVITQHAYQEEVLTILEEMK